MAKFRVILTLAAVLSFFVLTSSSSGIRASNTATGGESIPAGFELPLKHKSSLTPTEQRGASSYAYYCSSCHGKTGQGDGFNSSQLTSPPAKHADAAFMSSLSDADIDKVIKDGGPALGKSPQMPPWGGVLKDRDVADLVAFIRTLSKE